MQYSPNVFGKRWPIIVNDLEYIDNKKVQKALGKKVANNGNGSD